jgi:hypothetical protein
MIPEKKTGNGEQWWLEMDFSKSIKPALVTLELVQWPWYTRLEVEDDGKEDKDKGECW